MTKVEQVYLFIGVVSRGIWEQIGGGDPRRGAKRREKGEGGSRIYKTFGFWEFGRWATGVRVGKSAGHWPSTVTPA